MCRAHRPPPAAPSRHLLVVLGDAGQEVVHEFKPPAGVGLLTRDPLDGRRDVTGEDVRGVGFVDAGEAGGEVGEGGVEAEGAQGSYTPSGSGGVISDQVRTVDADAPPLTSAPHGRAGAPAAQLAAGRWPATACLPESSPDPPVGAARRPRGTTAHSRSSTPTWRCRTRGSPGRNVTGNVTTPAQMSPAVVTFGPAPMVDLQVLKQGLAAKSGAG
jgi:hypothetical protein